LFVRGKGEVLNSEKGAVFVRKKWWIALIICFCLGIIVLAAILLLRPHLNTYIDAWFV